MVIDLRPPCTLSREKNGALCFSDGRSPWDLALFSFGKPWDFILPTLYYCNLDRYYRFRTIHVLTDTISVAVCDVSGLYMHGLLGYVNPDGKQAPAGRPASGNGSGPAGQPPGMN